MKKFVKETKDPEVMEMIGEYAKTSLSTQFDDVNVAAQSYLYYIVVEYFNSENSLATEKFVIDYFSRISEREKMMLMQLKIDGQYMEHEIVQRKKELVKAIERQYRDTCLYLAHISTIANSSKGLVRVCN